MILGVGRGDLQVHEHSGNALASILWPGVELVMEEVVVRLVLLPIFIMQNLQPLSIHLWDVRHKGYAPLNRLDHLILLHQGQQRLSALAKAMIRNFAPCIPFLLTRKAWLPFPLTFPVWVPKKWASQTDVITSSSCNEGG